MTPEPVALLGRHDDEASTRRVLSAYFDAFAAGALAEAVTFLDERVLFDRGSWPALRGRDEFESFYDQLWAHGRETVVVESMTWQPPAMRVQLAVDLVMHADWAEFPGGGLRSGQRVRVRNRLDYVVAGGQILQILDQTPTLRDVRMPT